MVALITSFLLPHLNKLQVRVCPRHSCSTPQPPSQDNFQPYISKWECSIYALPRAARVIAVGAAVGDSYCGSRRGALLTNRPFATRCLHTTLRRAARPRHNQVMSCADDALVASIPSWDWPLATLSGHMGLGNVEKHYCHGNTYPRRREDGRTGRQQRRTQRRRQAWHVNAKATNAGWAGSSTGRQKANEDRQ